MRNQEENIELQKKVPSRICVRDIPFLAACSPCSVIFRRFFRPLRFYEEKKIGPESGGRRAALEFENWISLKYQ